MGLVSSIAREQDKQNYCTWSSTHQICEYCKRVYIKQHQLPTEIYTDLLLKEIWTIVSDYAHAPMVCFTCNECLECEACVKYL